MIFRWAVVSLAAAFILSIGIISPARNWDMIGYVAASFYKDGYRGEELREKTYSDIRSDVGEKMFNELTIGEYRRTVFDDPNSLAQQIPFYSIRMAYVECIRAGGKIGISYSKSTYLVSSLFASLAIVVVGVLLYSLNVSVLMLIPVVFSIGFTSISSFSTPDSMACFFSVLLLFCSKREWRFSLVLAALIPLIRTDFIIISMLIQLYYYVFFDKMSSVVSLFFSVAVLFFVNKFNGNYGWITIFNFSLINRTPYPASLVPSADIMAYVRPYFSAIDNLIRNIHFIVYSLGVYVVFINRKSIDKKFFYLFFFAPAMFVVVHLVLFPAYMDRFFVFSATTMYIGVCASLKFKVKISDRPQRFTKLV